MVQHSHFTRRALKILELSEREAQRLQHPYVGTEHILLGLLLEGNGLAANVLKERGIQYQDVQQAINQILASGSPQRHRKRNFYTTLALSGVAAATYFVARRRV
ncbi:hypothetical protein KDW_12500 [Dictyobacter vulcani]|uniref:Clp R domain-containing protein n=1 Tax=Dictyobacter vulcani TaxID=2607529 RepID=A0A5J4KDK5_9CHLR|nr:Clp protease N-terminal domain-containing protein [Dictyobacter vulcani]GER87088.1 hypothetical protein KDW_12500 [Dictyobacter vulcani]